jgi:gamma-butyrobetaine dioxygenase
MSQLPWTPDFQYWPIDHQITSVAIADELITLIWSDGVSSQYHPLLLRENSPEASTIHPLAREMAVLPIDLDDKVQISHAEVQVNGALEVVFTDGLQSAYHPGWLRGVAWFGEDDYEAPSLWRAGELAEPPSFDGPKILIDEVMFLAWLQALKQYGVARLQNLPDEDGLLERIVGQIGPIRETNFGRQYVLDIKHDPDSLAYTPSALPLHIDMPSRECPHGIQFLYIRENSVVGGQGTYVDAYRIAEDMRVEEPEHFVSLTTDHWQYANRAKDCDYRATGPVVETDVQGRITGIRYNTFLRSPMAAPPHIQGRAYRAYRAFCARAEDPRYLLPVTYNKGDLFAFDNRRALHGRLAYEDNQGRRFIEGIYADRDDLYSRIRLLKRNQAQA